MQRVAPTVTRVRPLINSLNTGGAGPSTATSQPHAPVNSGQVDPASEAVTPAVFATDDDDWNFVQQPVSPSEVADALGDLSTATGLPIYHVRSRSDGSLSSDLSDDFRSNQIIARADQEIASPMEQICSVVSNVLNDRDAGPAICNALAKDPTFRGMVQQYTGGAPLIPASAQRLALTSGPQVNDNPIDKFINGVMDAVLRAVCALGNAIRQLPDDIAILLRGINQNARARAAHMHRHVVEEQDRQWEAALKRVITAVAVALIARRAVLRIG